MKRDTFRHTLAAFAAAPALLVGVVPGVAAASHVPFRVSFVSALAGNDARVVELLLMGVGAMNSPRYRP